MSHPIFRAEDGASSGENFTSWEDDGPWSENLGLRSPDTGPCGPRSH